VQNYIRLARQLNISIDMVLFSRTPMVILYNKLLTKSLFSNFIIHFLCSLPMVVYLVSCTNKNKKIFYVEPHTVLSIYIISILQRDFGLIIHDDPISYLKRHGLNKNLKNHYHKMFHKCLEKSNFGFVISEYMRDSYGLATRDRFQVLHITYTDTERENHIFKSTDDIVLGLFGQPFSQSIEGKDIDPVRLIANTELQDRMLKVKIFNCNYNYTEANIETFSWLDRQHYIQQVSECNVSLVDDDPIDVDFANYSFPTKLVFSLSCGLPIVYSGPKNSVVSNYIQENGIGVHVSLKSNSDVRQSLSKLERNYKRYSKNCIYVYNRDFNEDVARKKIKKVLS
jgi:hypothetical protein